MFSRLYGVLLPFFVSFLLAYVLDPIVVFIQTKCRVRNRALAVVVTLVLAIGIVVGAIAALRKPVMEQVNTAWVGFQNYIATFDINQYMSAETQEKLLQWQEEWDWKSLLANPELTTSIKELLPKIGNWITGGLSWMSELVVVFIGFMYLIFLMIDFPNIRANYSKFIPRKIRPRVVTLMGDIDRNMNAYFRGQATVATCVGVLFAIGFTITDGIDHRSAEHGAIHAGIGYSAVYRAMPNPVGADRATCLAHTPADGNRVYRRAKYSGYGAYA